MLTIDRIRAHARKQPDALAYCRKGERLTYGSLWSKAAKAAETLSRWPTDRIILYGDKEGDLVAAMLACLMAQKTYIPVTVGTPPERFRWICDVTKAGLILTSQQAPDIADIPVRSLQELNSDLPAQSTVSAGEACVPNASAYIIFTSGSTGQPKGVQISRDNLDNFVRWICSLPPLDQLSGIRVMNQAAFSFDLSVADLYFSLCTGNTLCVLPSADVSDPEAVISFLRITGCALMICTPTFLKLCLLDSGFQAETLPELCCIYSCGEILEPGTAGKLLKRFPALALINAYGPTEATSAVCGCLISKEMADNGNPLPVGQTEGAACDISICSGEIVLSGRSVFSGYLTQEGALALSTCDPEKRIYHTGDFGAIRDGLLYCKGRKDRQIKWKGYRIELDEIECQLDRIPGVKSSAVIAKKSPSGIIRFLKAFVSAEDDLSSEKIRDYLSKNLPEYMIPKVISILPALPINRNGKIDRKELENL